MTSGPILRAADGTSTDRFSLSRCWGAGPEALWIMLNPSTADDQRDDPTIHQCMKISRRLGCGSLYVVNWFTRRSPHPSDLRRWHSQLQDFEAWDDLIVSLSIIEEYCNLNKHKCGLIICAWGNPPSDDMESLIDAGLEELRGKDFVLHHLGLTKSGNPKHSLARGKHRIADDQPLIRWS